MDQIVRAARVRTRVRARRKKQPLGCPAGGLLAVRFRLNKNWSTTGQLSRCALALYSINFVAWTAVRVDEPYSRYLGR